jgi:hypothetical protein
MRATTLEPRVATRLAAGQITSPSSQMARDIVQGRVPTTTWSVNQYGTRRTRTVVTRVGALVAARPSLRAGPRTHGGLGATTHWTWHFGRVARTRYPIPQSDGTRTARPRVAKVGTRVVTTRQRFLADARAQVRGGQRPLFAVDATHNLAHVTAARFALTTRSGTSQHTTTVRRRPNRGRDASIRRVVFARRLVGGTSHTDTLLAAATLLCHVLCARWARAVVTRYRAPMHPTIQHSFADFSTRGKWLQARRTRQARSGGTTTTTTTTTTQNCPHIAQ